MKLVGGVSMGPEKRKFERLASGVVGNCLVSGREDNKLKGNIIFTKDISCRGAKIVTHMNFKPGERVMILLHLPTCFLPMLANSMVTWIRDIDASKCRILDAKEAGVEFIGMEPADELKLTEFLSFKQKQDATQEVYSEA